MFADLLALDGWDERFLGADVPVGDFARKAQELAPRVIGISTALQAHVPMLRATIEAVRGAAPSAKIVVGGLLAADPDGVAATLGVDAVARSGFEAVEVARGWR